MPLASIIIAPLAIADTNENGNNAYDIAIKPAAAINIRGVDAASAAKASTASRAAGANATNPAAAKIAAAATTDNVIANIVDDIAIAVIPIPVIVEIAANGIIAAANIKTAAAVMNK